MAAVESESTAVDVVRTCTSSWKRRESTSVPATVATRCRFRQEQGACVDGVGCSYAKLQARLNAGDGAGQIVLTLAPVPFICMHTTWYMHEH